MNEEEKESIEWLKRLVKINKRDNLDDTFAEILLNLIEKQSKEIEELKEVKWYYEISRVPKEKIKAKIEEYKKQIEKMEKDDNGIGFTLGKEWSDLKAKVEFGQSLLEKE